MVERVPPFRIKVGNKRSPTPWIYVILFLFFMGILLVLYIQSPLSQVEQVRIDGNRLISKKQVLKTTALKQGASFFYANTTKMERKLQQLPEVQRVEIEKTFPNHIDIHIQEHPVIAYVQGDDGWFVPVLWDGSLLPHRRTAELIESSPVIEHKDRTNQTVQLALRNLLQVPSEIRTEVGYIYSVPNRADQVRLLSEHHHQIYVRANDLHKKLVYYPRFRDHPQGTLYLLNSIWFRPDSHTEKES